VQVSSLAAVLASLAVACARVDPVAPGTHGRAGQPAAVRADPEVTLRSMQAECDAMLAALATYQACVHHEDDEREGIAAWIERATRDLAASRKANPEPKAQHVIAAACHKATGSVAAATIRCAAGPRPKQ
jgi:TPP-dependent trihydroxycyclohexane-1,2-dione (THcHDO) dehydratase